MTDSQKLQGTWTITSLQMEGSQVPSTGGQIIVKGSTFITLAMGGEYAGTVSFDESSTPKHFDLTFTEGPHKGKKSLGIYELHGDDWKLCLALAGINRRPKTFATHKGDGFALETLKRGAPAPAPTPEADPDHDPGPVTELEGEWTMVSGSMNGHAMDARLVPVGRRICKGSLLTVLFGKQVFMKAHLIVDPSKTPRTLDYALGNGDTQKGIYEWDGPLLKICMAASKKKRPKTFKSGPGLSVSVWKRAIQASSART
jgi:uncharacterized protein (TIGR03067 family)